MNGSVQSAVVCFAAGNATFRCPPSSCCRGLGPTLMMGFSPTESRTTLCLEYVLATPVPPPLSANATVSCGRGC